ncbi:efflux RND transporter periplasmic adaptor subunit [Enterovibrio paralichthyis]|uniref:efflux RND transporter periplasmic adaptor subunit n=1 Tax=Enterovibrio paralichthyis TaxID=2853805 RepID=UPI001C4384EB|nr:efflux RND transporter periplasmic adaptor subunit [Enterovibrio paralichthyis]MBV7298475.1 efflux RND transporter periplasmic adaptor subunit [Enterovibrio paralichthyis]
MKARMIAMLASAAVMVLVFAYMAGLFVPDLPPVPERAVQTPAAEYLEVDVVEMPQSRQFSGTVRAHQSAELASRINAKVADVLVDAGDAVKAGDILLRLESDDLSARVIQQQQALASAQAQVNDARINYDRVRKLVDRGLLPVAERDAAKVKLDTANAELAGRTASLSEAEVNRNFSVITAPFDGVISKRSVNQGDIATVGANLISIYNPNSLRLEAAISESVLPKLADTDQFDIVLDTNSHPLKARAQEIEPAADAASRSFTVKFGFDEKEGLYPGMFGRVSVPLDTVEVLAVPQDAVISRGQLRYVHVQHPEKNEDMRIVRLGETFQHNNEEWVTISAGLNKGERIQLP